MNKTSFWFQRILLLVFAYIIYLFCWQYAFGNEDRPISLQAFEGELKQHVHVHSSGPNTIGHLYIGDHSEAISQSTWIYVKKGLEYYQKTKPIFIILELNSPGGEVFAAQTISDALKEMDTQFDIPIVAYVNNWAISAGALLAYSCRFIVVAKDGSMGGAEPVFEGAEGTMVTASEKINSVIRTDFANRARFFNRDPLIAEGMVDKEIILVIRDGHVIKLDNDSQIVRDGPHPDKILSAKGKLLTLDADQMIELGVADMLIPPTKTIPITEKEQEEGKWAAAKSALFHQPFFDAIPDATIDAYRMDWKMRFFALLNSPFISSLLVMGLIIGFYLEISNPGLTLPGTVAGICLFLITLSSFSLEVANWLELIFLLTGLCIILVEIFVLPTFGLLGFLGIACFLMGLFGMLIPGVGSVEFELDTLSLNAAGHLFIERLGWLCGTLLASIAIIALLMRYITPKTAGLNRFVLYGGEQTGYMSMGDLEQFPKPGSKGTAETTLRPGGKVMINSLPYDAISRGPLIERGASIVVVGIDGGTLIVALETNVL